MSNTIAPGGDENAKDQSISTPGASVTRASTDVINHPAHYTHATIEPINVIESWSLGFHLGNAVKYIARAEHKGSRLEDLKKARWYLDREIARSERQP